MKVDCDIEGVLIRKLEIHEDHRGWLAETFRHDEMDEEFYPAMSYVAVTRPGVTRGPHEHVQQADNFAFVGPSTFRLYLWDNRPGSSTFGNKVKIEAGQNAPLSVLIPAGVVHAYKNIGGIDGVVYNAPNRLFMGDGKKDAVDEIRHEDDLESPFVIDDQEE